MVVLLRFARPPAVSIGGEALSTVLSEQSGEAYRDESVVARVLAPGHQVGRTVERTARWNEVSLISMVLVDQPKEIPAKAEVDSQLAGELDVVVTIHTVIVFAVVRKREDRKSTRLNSSHSQI